MAYVQLVFSPTGGTRKVAQAITEGWGTEVSTIDLTDPSVDFSRCSLAADDLVLIAVPSFGGRVPALAIRRLALVHGNGAHCVLTCVYGNRAYEDTLAELQDAAEQCGFRVLAAVAAVAEHSIMHQYAAGRPDEQDTRTLKDFSQKILAKFRSDSQTAPAIPGNRPYRKAGGGMVPQADASCIGCGLCAKQCPARAISADNVRKADSRLCISCMRCVVQCPHSARKVNGAMVAAAALAMKKVCSVRKECELFI